MFRKVLSHIFVVKSYKGSIVNLYMAARNIIMIHIYLLGTAGYECMDIINGSKEEAL